MDLAPREESRAAVNRKVAQPRPISMAGVTAGLKDRLNIMLVGDGGRRRRRVDIGRGKKDQPHDAQEADSAETKNCFRMDRHACIIAEIRKYNKENAIFGIYQSGTGTIAL